MYLECMTFQIKTKQSMYNSSAKPDLGHYGHSLAKHSVLANVKDNNMGCKNYAPLRKVLREEYIEEEFSEIRSVDVKFWVGGSLFL